MLHFPKQLLSLRHPASPVILSLRRALLSTAAATDAPPGAFAAVDYLVTTCGLTPEQALKAARYISHCKSTSNADSVLAFLSGPALRLSKADIARVVSHDPRILNCSVENTLKARIASLRSYGLDDAQVRTFLRVTHCVFRTFSIQEKLGFWIPFLGSPEKLLRVLRHNYYLLTSDLDRVVKPNIATLRESGMSPADIARMCVPNSRLLTCNPDTVKSILERADKLGVPRNSPMFRQAVATTTGLGAETMAAKLKLFGETLGCSAAEVASAVRRNPVLLKVSGEKLRRVVEFLTKVVRVDTTYILARPAIVMYSLETRLAPRYSVMKALQEKHLIRKDHSFYSMVTSSDETFRRRHTHPHKDLLPGLDDAYMAACRGKTAHSSRAMKDPSLTCNCMLEWNSRSTNSDFGN
ncbi:transcription termination factor MTERF2, chloroplastic-like isoform X2 [Lolium rigidum]|uniref:transcription termination factor MTERF2, chloroplastic-like isoform X2 n=1 Tax=Lolium rigidum TaxID=89674 RepID=UPI001F5D7637|nr:transcription termination factor MTERF2, chloroplastic-like isoform X2 [Lolium rigidum]XP_047077974.1 transcription termination factor MTERF2, chloroplastic-like isoform X2 [Lolium rigidum]